MMSEENWRLGSEDFLVLWGQRQQAARSHKVGSVTKVTLSEGNLVVG